MPRHETRLTAIALVIGTAAAVTVVWAAAPPPQPIDCSPHTSGNTPLGTSWDLTPPTEHTVGSNRWYNFTVVSIGAGYELDNLAFQVQTATGGTVVAGAGWTLTVMEPPGQSVGVYSMTGPTAGNWTSGGTHPLLTGQTVSLLTTPVYDLGGDSLIVLGTGSSTNGCPFAGSVSVSIP